MHCAHRAQLVLYGGLSPKQRNLYCKMSAILPQNLHAHSSLFTHISHNAQHYHSMK